LVELTPLELEGILQLETLEQSLSAGVVRFATGCFVFLFGFLMGFLCRVLL
jgi:hypothetical protein